jgi:hypothetical protein
MNSTIFMLVGLILFGSMTTIQSRRAHNRVDDDEMVPDERDFGSVARREHRYGLERMAQLLNFQRRK